MKSPKWVIQGEKIPDGSVYLGECRCLPEGWVFLYEIMDKPEAKQDFFGGEVRNGYGFPLPGEELTE